jgi:hypothetical protein
MSDHIIEWLGAYHDGELGASAARRIEAHLAECTACRAALDETRGLSDLLQADVPNAEFLSPDRFAANLALNLPRRAAGPQAEPQPRSAGRIAWWMIPVSLLALLLMIEVTLAIGSAVTVVADSGLFGENLGWLQGNPVRMSWFSSVIGLFGDRLGAPGFVSLSILNDANVLIAQLVKPLIIQALPAAAYLGWLLAWWLNSSEKLKN